MLLRCRLLWNNAVLPKEYQQVEYIQSNGSQYISTGILSPSTITRIEANMELEITQLSIDWQFFCGYGTDGRYYSLNTSAQNRSNMFNMYVGTNDYNHTLDTFTLNTKYNYQIIYDSNHWTSNNLTTQFSKSGACNTTYGNVSFHIFTRNESTSSTTDIPRYHSYIKLYHFNLIQNNQLICDFYPCYCKRNGIGWKNQTSQSVTSNTVGLYDIVRKRFYINSGSGTFTAGPSSKS